MAHDVFIFVPAFGQQITATTFLATHALRQHLIENGIGGGISTLSFPNIAELRNIALTIWYDAMPNSSHILFIDADMGFPPQLVMSMLALGEPVVGAIYPHRKLETSWVGSIDSPSPARRGDFIEVDGIGFGVALVAREV